MKDLYGIPENISTHFCTLINKEKFEPNEWNYITPRSVEKAINQIGNELETPYDELLLPFLKQKITLAKDNQTLNYKSGDEIEFLEVLKVIIKKIDTDDTNITNRLKIKLKGYLNRL